MIGRPLRVEKIIEDTSLPYVIKEHKRWSADHLYIRSFPARKSNPKTTAKDSVFFLPERN
ncbi:MAG: hypothetical protein AAF587_30580 [Bacteroidota bacterium]